MKGDFSRNTFAAEKHYSGVRQQQGRVHLDADWNEQLDIAAHRTRTETVDVVGPCGGPLAAAGFRIVADTAALDADEQARPGNQDPPALAAAGDFYVSAGRYYVGGTLCENEHIVNFAGQADYPGAAAATDSGIYVAWLDVWQRHVTALEDDTIREVALGGPDTATRQKTLWQVRLVRAGDLGDSVNCLGAVAALDDATAAPTGAMAARAEPGAVPTGPCIIAESAGYRRLENQLYRIEVHAGGPRGTATFKWSRDNGAVVARWEASDGDELTVSEAGRDKVLAFAAGTWVELTDDEHELHGAPGTLVRLLSVSDRVLALDAATADGPTDLASFGTNPKVRRWDSDGVVTPTGDDWIDLEDGVQVRFTAGSYRTADYWTVPARTNTGEVEWPAEATSGDPLESPPHGIGHDWCRLAVMSFDGTAWTAIEDCRDLFPPLTGLTTLDYVSGDGQEALPDAEVDKPLQVGVSNGEHPVAGALVRFARVTGDGTLMPGASAEVSGSPTERLVLTDALGIAECRLMLGTAAGERTHCVEAALLDAAGDAVHLPVRFNASLSLASQVYYDGNACPTLADADTVQDALDTLAAQAILVARAGDGQDTGPGQPVPRPVEAAVVDACGPVTGATVRFTPEGNGRVAATAADLPGAAPGPLDLLSGADGVAAVAWQLDPDPALTCQFLFAELVDAGGRALRQPTRIAFTACVAQSAGCYDFLDELRADGIVRGADGTLGLAVTRVPGATDVVAHAGGIAYVGGCRFVIEAGTVELDPGTLPNTVIVDDRGAVVLLDKGSEPPAFARLADVALFGGRIVRIVDRRLDVTHLDLRVEAVAAATAQRRVDRRGAIPELARAVPSLRLRDGRNFAMEFTEPTDLPYGMAFDGSGLWAGNARGTAIFVIDPAAFPFAPPQRVDVGDITADCVYDGGSHVWFSSPVQADGDSTNNRVHSVDVRTREVTTYEVGDFPLRMTFDGGRVWVANFGSSSLSVIDVSRGELAMTVALQDLDGGSVTPTALTFDGEHVWAGTSSDGLFRIDMLGQVEAMTDVFSPDLGGVDWLSFDGALLWIVPSQSTVLRHDVVTGVTQSVAGVRGDAAVSDAMHMWVGQREDLGISLQAVRCATGFPEGSIRIPGDASFVVGLASDGNYLWYTAFESGRSMLGRHLVA